MGININYFIALFAGLISFLSPCILPVIPSYLSFIGGVSYGDLTGKKISRWAIFIKTMFFVLGFSAVFVVLGVVFSGVGIALSSLSRVIYMVAGTVVIALGLNFIFDFWKILNLEKRFHFRKRPHGVIGPVLVGMAFGAGWTPCIGPILASILFLAGTSSQGLKGTLLLAVYSAGLGIPFILAGLFFSSFQKQMERIKPYLRTVKMASGVFLVFIGLLIFSGSLTKLNVFFFKIASELEIWADDNPRGPRMLFSFPFLVPSLLLIFFYWKRAYNLVIRSGLAVKTLVFPLRLIFIVFLSGLTALTLTGFIDFTKLIVQWLNFQGI
ncbi:MAG TPA: cytochrome c biogenesis protein CcdA [bacterium]|nr:cytochrome c biogenesis protein CcdA [bacterium]